MRIDRFVTLRLVWPLKRVGSGTSDQWLPILMYHSISPDPELGVRSYYKVCTSPQRFAQNMQWLADAGRKGVTLKEGLDILEGRKAANTPAVVITFDDGFRDFYTHAAPVLRRHGFSATMYLPTGFISDERKTFNGRDCLTWREVKELSLAGIEMGSHTVNHPKLVELTWPQIMRELADSRSAIEDRLEVPVPSFAYPFAFPQGKKEFTERLTEALQTTGFSNCVTTEIGREFRPTSAYRLKRLPVNSDDDEQFFVAKINGAYDWLSRPQALIKKLRG
jgi:peptidoglycan/xylan/chitin deacetylase (PgdA/CDA1 family)